ncbi:MAG: hypothetical protein RQ875_05510 [Vicingaceae bacterium]|nr:hypothetical protein [Vicingaceae bacterium]
MKFILMKKVIIGLLILSFISIVGCKGKRTGAVCNDGSKSTATSSGACSHHGGVDYWTYENNEK